MTCFRAIVLLFKYALEIEKNNKVPRIMILISIKGTKEKSYEYFDVPIADYFHGNIYKRKTNKKKRIYFVIFLCLRFPENKNHGQFLCNLCFLLIFHAYFCSHKKESHYMQNFVRLFSILLPLVCPQTVIVFTLI